MSCKKTTYESGFTFERLESLEAAIAEGVLTVKYSDKLVTYRSMDEMLKARDLIRRKLGLKKSCGSKGLFGGSRIVAKHSKGLDGCE
jgi:hypothetical protein